MKIRNVKSEVFNLRNKKCQSDFYNHKNQTEQLSNSLVNRDVLAAGKHWLKTMKTMVHQNFRKVRITNQKYSDKVQDLLSEKSSPEVDQQITEEIYKRNKQVIIEQITEMSDQSGNMTRLKMWKIKQKVCPKRTTSVPVAKLDEDGNLVCNREQLKQLYTRVYKDRLRHRTERPECSQM